MDKGDKAAAEIPSEIITDIIVRLPIIKGIINSSSVCKVWHNLIFGQPYFADMHLRRSSSHETLRFSLLTNQHKVLRIMEKPRSWRRRGFVPYSYYDNVFLVTFNGVMYWFVAYTEILFDQICSFRIRNQQNRQISYHPNSFVTCWEWCSRSYAQQSSRYAIDVSS
ncbi:hypothetical protein Peur_073608 [Populus x canadensis]